jgi:YbbR domain-containing protein
MKRWIFENFGLKVLAVFIALALWAYVGSRQVVDRKMTLHIEFTDIPTGVTLGSNVKTSIPVLLNGRKESVLDLDQDDLKALVSLKGYLSGQREMTVHPRIEGLPSGVTANVSDFTVPLAPPTDPKNPPKKKLRK